MSKGAIHSFVEADGGWLCACGTKVARPGEIRAHFREVGLCPVCWGVGLVLTDIGGTALDCPSCGGTGSANATRPQYKTRMLQLLDGDPCPPKTPPATTT